MDLRFVFIKSKEFDDTVLTMVNSIAFAGMIHFLKNVFSTLFAFPDKRGKIFLPMYICLLLIIINSVFAFFDFDFFSKYLLKTNFLFATIGPFFMLGVYIVWLVKSGTLLKNSHLLIVISFILTWIEMTIEVTPYLLHFHYPFKDTYLFNGISVFIWSYLLADKFNKEHFELKVLKNNLEEKIIERTKELEFAIETRTNTFINLSHEIKTPLTLINSYLDKYISKYGSTFEMNIIKDNVDKLVRDITNSFIEEKFRKGIIPEDNNYIINLSNTIAVKSIVYKEIANKKDISFHVNVEENILIKSHPNTIDSIINNLVENAIKYIPEKGTISLSLHSENNKTILIVKDNGDGISKDFQEKIFEPGFQISGRKQNYQGIGMGLYIVKMMVNSIGGRIKINSSENEGTEFTLEFGRYYPSGDELITDFSAIKPLNILPNSKAEDILNNQINNTILIVEDNSQMLQYLANELKQHFNVYIAMNGNQALERLRIIPRPDLILTDVMMDNMDGFRFIEIISKELNLNSIPVIFLTAKTTESDKLNGLHLGAVDYIYKPFKIEEIISKALSIVNKTEQQKKYLAGSVAEFLNNKFEIDTTNSVPKKNTFDFQCFSFKISQREKEIVVLLSQGLTYKMMAEKLFISESTVAKHVQNIYEKTETKNRTDLLRVLFND